MPDTNYDYAISILNANKEQWIKLLKQHENQTYHLMHSKYECKEKILALESAIKLLQDNSKK